MIDDREYFVNSQEALKEAASTFFYLLPYALPGVPTACMIWEYTKPKEKRDPIKIEFGWIATDFLTSKIVLTSLGIISLPQIIEKGYSYFSSEEITIEQPKINSNKLEKTFYLNDIESGKTKE